MTPRRPKPKPFAARLLENLDAKWVATVLVGLVGASGIMRTDARVDAQRDASAAQFAAASGGYSALKATVDSLRVEVDALRRARSHRGGPGGAIATGDEPEATPVKRGPVARLWGLLTGPFRRG